MFGQRIPRVTMAAAAAAVLAGTPLPVRAQTPTPPPPAPSASAAAAGQEEAGPVTNVGGKWELNWRQSDRTPEVSEPGRGERGEGGGGRRGGGGGGGRGGGMGGRGGMMGAPGGMGRGGEGRSAPSAETIDQMRDFMNAARTLVIVEHPDRVSITDESGQVQKLVTNGEKQKDERGGKSFERTTRWDGRTLITEIALAGGMKITQTFQKVAEGLQLVVTTKIEGKGMPGGASRELKRVYDQALESKRP
jgi:hypothetical protein